MKIHEGKCTEKILKERERIGSRLAILRKKRNMTQEELANLCGVNRLSSTYKCNFLGADNKQ